MLPFDNKPEFSVVVNMPEGTALPVTANLAHRIAEKLRNLPEVTAIQVYAGTAKPFDFNGMVRHYYLRTEPWQGEVQVQLLHKSKRDRTSHDIAVEAREMVDKLVEGTGAKIAVVEMPPGPPVLQSVVAEVHGPTPEIRRQFARDLTAFFEQAESTRDVDNYLRDAYDYWRFDVDTEKAVRRGISVDAINRNLGMALGGSSIGDVKKRSGHEPVEIVLQVPLAERSQIDSLGDLPIQSNGGFTVPLRELGRFQRVPEEDIIYRKDLRAVEYVVADVGGRLAAPVYAMFQIQDLIDASDYKAPDGVVPQAHWLGPPPSDRQSSWEWAGEWTVTYETFRDMGAAFMVPLVLIYILVVWEFGNFRIPLVIMAPIPLTLLGIIPAHFLMFQLGLGGEFTATSMIGWIALAGIIVRNSILLVDFSIHEVQKGVPVAEAVIRSCKTRTRPILITALALVAGSSVIFTDQIFQGMAISLASGVLVSTVLTLIVIPLGCVAASKDLCEVAVATAPRGVSVPCSVEEDEKRQKKVRVKPAGGGLIKVWGFVVEAVVLVFYAVRGIFLLLFDLIKNLFKKKRVPPPPPRPSTSGTGGAPSGGGGGTPAPSTGPGGEVSASAPASESAASAESDQQPPAEGQPETASKEPPRQAPSASVAPDREMQAASPAQPPAARTPAAVPQESAKRASSPAVEPAKEGRVAVAKAPAPKQRAAKKRVAKKSSAKTAAKSGATSPAMAQKKAPRRGIRLKADGGRGPSFD
jgi:hypothetical protein